MWLTRFIHQPGSKTSWLEKEERGIHRYFESSEGGQFPSCGHYHRRHPFVERNKRKGPFKSPPESASFFNLDPNHYPNHVTLYRPSAMSKLVATWKTCLLLLLWTPPITSSALIAKGGEIMMMILYISISFYPVCPGLPRQLQIVTFPSAKTSRATRSANLGFCEAFKTFEPSSLC